MANSKRMDSALAHLLKSLAGNSLLSRKTVDDMLDQLNFGDNGVLKEELYGTESKAKSPPTLYDTLEVAQSASLEEIKASYRRLAKAHHPDVGGDSDKFHEIASAYRILSDGKQRLRYDKSLALTYVVKSKTVDDPFSPYRPGMTYPFSTSRGQSAKKTIAVNFIGRQPWAIAPTGTYVLIDYSVRDMSRCFTLAVAASSANGLVIHESVTPIGLDRQGNPTYSHDYTIEIL